MTDSCLSHDPCWSEICWCGFGGGPAADGCYWEAALTGPCEWYWSSSATGAVYPAWDVAFSNGGIGYYHAKLYTGYVRCVHTGP